MMKCPYAVNRDIISQSSYEYDEEGRQTVTTEIIHNDANFVNCMKEECGAYKNGRCNYKGD